MSGLQSTVAPPLPHGALARFLAHPNVLVHAVLRVLVHVGEMLATTVSRAAPVLIGGLAIVVVAAVVYWSKRAKRLSSDGRLITILAPPGVERAGAEMLWSNLVALLRPPLARMLRGQPHIGFEIRASSAGLRIALWVPSSVPPGQVERAIEAAWPGARTETEPATPPLPLGDRSTGGELRLFDGEHYPLRTDHPVDPLRTLLGALSGLDEEQSACVQVLARPVTGNRLAKARRAAVTRRQGRPTSRFARLLDLVTPGPVTRPIDSDPFRARDVALITEKSAQPSWAVVVRYGVATSANGANAKAQLRGRAGALVAGYAVFTARNGLRRHRLSHVNRVLAARRLGRGSLVSVGELAVLAHLPTDVVVPGLARAGAKSVAVPAEVRSIGKVLGDADAGSRRPVALGVHDGRYHLHVLGATGSGKSTLLTRLILDDIVAGRGAVVIDPKGDLVTDILERMPIEAGERTVLIDAGDLVAPPVMNVLDATEPDHDLVVDNLVGIFRRIFEAFWGPRTDDIFRSACLTLLRYGSNEGVATSLADVPRLLSDEAFRAPRIAAITEDSVALGGFWKSYVEMGDAQRAQVVGPLMNKLRAFLLRDFVRLVVGRPDSTFSMGEALDGGICLVRIPKGIVGEETSRLLGSLVVAKVWQAVTNRARLGQLARLDTSLYVDECQNFLNLPRSFDEMLAEARGYGLSLVLAHQYLSQLPRELRDAVSSNARTKVYFKMGPEDARSLERHVMPELSEHDLSHLGGYQAAVRLVVDGEEAPAFTMRTRPAPAAEPGRADAIRTDAHARGRAAEQNPAPLLAAGDVPEETRIERSGANDDAPGIVPPVVSGIVPGIADADDPYEHDESAGPFDEVGSSPTSDWWVNEW